MASMFHLQFHMWPWRTKWGIILALQWVYIPTYFANIWWEKKVNRSNISGLDSKIPQYWKYLQIFFKKYKKTIGAPCIEVKIIFFSKQISNPMHLFLSRKSYQCIIADELFIRQRSRLGLYVFLYTDVVCQL